MTREEIREKCREINRRLRFAQRTERKIEMGLGKIQRQCQHDFRGGSGSGGDTCIICGAYTIDDCLGIYYADSSSLDRLAGLKFHRQMLQKHRIKRFRRSSTERSSKSSIESDEIRRKQEEIRKVKGQLERAHADFTDIENRLKKLREEYQKHCSHPNKIIGGSGDGGDTCEDCGKFWFD